MDYAKVVSERRKVRHMARYQKYIRGPIMKWSELTNEQQEYVRTLPAFQHRDGTPPTQAELNRMEYSVMTPTPEFLASKYAPEREKHPYLSCRDNYALASFFPRVK